MGSSYDIERVGPELELDPTLTVENFVEIQQRVIKLESILEKRLTQWNAPALLRYGLDNRYIQVQDVACPSIAAGGSAAVAFTYTEAFDGVPAILTSPYWDGTVAGRFYANVQASTVTTTGATLTIINLDTAQAVSTGSVIKVYTIGQKVL